jgi:hypothetical protein
VTGRRVEWGAALGRVLATLPRFCLVRFDALEPREAWIPSRELRVLS